MWDVFTGEEWYVPICPVHVLFYMRGSKVSKRLGAERSRCVERGTK